MKTSFESGSERSQTSTQELPTTPTIQEMESWDGGKLLRWIEQRNHGLLADNDLDTLEKLRFTGLAFLAADYRFFHEVCHLPPVASLGLERLADQVQNGKFIP